MPKAKPSADPFSTGNADPFANLQVTPTNEVHVRATKPLNESAVKLIEASYNNGEPVPMLTQCDDIDQAKAVVKELRRAADAATQEISLQTSIRDDEVPGRVTVRFKARKRIYKPRKNKAE